MSEVGAVFENILIGGRAGEDLYNRIFVVSAYGGMTDLLLEHKKTHEAGVYALYTGAESDWAWGDALSRVGEAMHGKNAEVFNDPADLDMADRFVDERIEGVRSCLLDLQRLCSFGHFKLQEHLITVREMLSAIGEAHSAYNSMLLLQRRSVNAVFVDLSGWRETEAMTLDERITRAFADIDLSRQLPIVTGYAQCREGLMGQYGRGYSEVTFSRVACLTGADEAIIHKEYHLSSADPKVVGVEKVQPIGRTNYDVADQLSNMGMEAIHPRAAKGLRQNGIPLRILNTFEPAHEGTTISEDWHSASPKAEIVTGLANAYEIEVFDQDMVSVVGAEERVLGQLGRFKVWSRAKNLNANTITHYVSAPLKQVRRCVDAIQEKLSGAQVRTRTVAIVSVIGSNLQSTDLFARAVTALNEAGVALLAAQQPSRMIDMQFVVAEDDFESAVRQLHRALVGKPEAAAKDTLKEAKARKAA